MKPLISISKNYTILLMLSILLLFSSINVHSFDQDQIAEDDEETGISVSSSQNLVDIEIKGEIYLSKPNPEVSDQIDIFAVINNIGDVAVDVKIEFTIKNSNHEKVRESEIYTIDPDDDKFGSISWITLEGETTIIAEAILIDETDINPSNNKKETIIQVDEAITTDFAIRSNDIIIQPNEDTDNYNIWGAIKNYGEGLDDTDLTLKLEVKDNTYGTSRAIFSDIIEINPLGNTEFTLEFQPTRSYHLLEFIISDFSISDTDRSNNRAVKEFYPPEDTDTINVDISDSLDTEEYYEIVQGEKKNIPLEVTSEKISDNFQVIVGGITQNVDITPDKWAMSLDAGVTETLTIEVSIDNNMEIGTLHTVEVQLYQRSDPSKIIKHSIPIIVVNSISDDLTSYSSSHSIDLSNQISTDETNPPTIDNVAITPLYPNFSENVTVSADVTDESTIINVDLYYSFDDGTSWTITDMQFISGNSFSGQIISPELETSVIYFVHAEDNFTNTVNSTQYSFLLDGTSPSILTITNPGVVSTQNTVPIFANSSDNNGIDETSAFLYYSFDNTTYSMLQMNLFNGSGQSIVFESAIPATENSIVYYYMEVLDISGLGTNTSINSYLTDDLPTINLVTNYPVFPHADNTTTINANITDDMSINNATLNYWFQNTTASLPMIENSGIFTADIPATINDTTVMYNITAFDSFGHNIWSIVYSYYSDGILPTVSNITISDNSPNYQQKINVTAVVQDSNQFRNVTLYYSFDGGETYNSINMSSGTLMPLPSYSADVLVVYSDVQDRGYLTRNGYTYDLMSASAFSSTNVATLSQYPIIILEPNWSSYNYLRNGLSTLSQVLDDYDIAVGIRVGGNQDSQVDIDFLGSDYERTLNNNEFFVDNNHPFITGSPWFGNTLSTSYFNTWGYTDHGYIYNLPTSQSGYTEILQNDDGISMLEYDFKGSPILLDTLTAIDGGWGGGNDIVADNYINYLNFTFWESREIQLKPDEYLATIPNAPADTVVEYYINATDMANNSRISEISSYFADGTGPQYANITQYEKVSEFESVTVNATIFDNVGIDNSSTYLFYTFDNQSYFQISMALLNGNSTYGVFQTAIPLTNQSQVYYYIEATDISGLTSQSMNSTYFVDRTPDLISHTTDPIYPHSNFSTIINATITDDYGVSNVSLYYNSNGTWLQLIMNEVEGIYQVTIPAINMNTTVFYLTQMNDTYGHSINSSIFSYYSDGVTPTIESVSLNPIIPNSESSIIVSAIIEDISGIQNATLHYSENGGQTWTNLTMSYNVSLWQTTIPAFNEGLTVDYFVSTYDNTGYHSNSSIEIFQTDQENPQISNISIYSIVSEFDTVTINSTVSDNLGIDESGVRLFYSTDNSTWFSTSMTNVTGNSTYAIFQGIIPPISNPTVYYYISAMDLSTRTNTSEIYTYDVDGAPVVNPLSISPVSPSAYENVTVNATLTDDVGITGAQIFYEHNSIWYQVSMSNVSGVFVGIIPAINTDTTVNYYISAVDTFGHRTNSSILNFYADGISPTFRDITFSPTTPKGEDDITVNYFTEDNQDLLNTTLYYTYNGTWVPVSGGEVVSSTYTGRDPTTGYYYGTTITQDYDSGPLSQLSVYVYSSDSDTLRVTLWGYRIDTNTWEQFHYSSSRGTGNLPDYNWATPIYDQWRIQMYDTENNDNIYYSYSYDAIDGYQVVIPAINQSANVEFYIESYDIASNRNVSSSYFFTVDVDPPEIGSVSNPGLTSELVSATITADVSDIVAIDPSNVILYYTFDNSTYFSSQMTLTSGNNQSGLFTGQIPTTGELTVYYYVNATDQSGFSVASAVQSYNVNLIPVVLSSTITPIYPDISSNVDVVVNVTDDDTITSVELVYEFEDGTSGTTSMDLIDGLYQGQIPATYTHNEVIYYFTLSDSFGHTIDSQNYSYIADGTAPSFSDINHQPSTPTDQDSVTVTSTISDDSELQTVRLYYSINNGNTWNTVTMTGTGSYSGIIPAQQGGVTVQYYIFAEDSAGNTNTSRILSYFVDSQFPVIDTILQVTKVSRLDTVTINTTISDNYGIDEDSLRLYYSYNNNTYFQLSMTKLGGTSTYGIYEATIPSTTNSIVYYYIRVQDLSGLTATSNILSYIVDQLPVLSSYSHTPSNPNGSDIIAFEVDASDDFAIANVTLHYNYNSTWYSKLFNLDINVFKTTVGPIDYDGDITYYIEIYDSYGHSITSSQVVQYVDNLNPAFLNVEQTPEQPSDSGSVLITSRITDMSGIVNATLYYAVNGSGWNPIDMIQSVADTVIGREPASGYHYGTTITRDYESQSLTRLSVYVYSSDSDTLRITLWGYRIDTNTWEQFHYTSSRGNGYLPEYNWATPIYDQWRIQILDTENNDNFYYSYEYDELSNWEANIPGYSEATNITYYLESFDSTGNSEISDTFSYLIDSIAPNIINVTQPGFASSSEAVEIMAWVSDSAGINISNSLIYYSFDNSTWSSTSLSLESGNTQFGNYLGVIPATSTEETVYYYFSVEDNSGYTTVSNIYTYDTHDITIELNSPSAGSVINGTGNLDLSLLIIPGNSTVEISFDNGNSWNFVANITNNIYVETVNATQIPEGEFSFMLNITITNGVSFIREFSLFIDRTSPEILQVTYSSVIDGNGHTISAVIREAVTQSNFIATLYYTYDNSTWYQTSMSLIGENQGNYTYSRLLLPSGGEEAVIFYVYVEDNLGLSNQSQTYQSQIDYSPIINNFNLIGDYYRSDTPIEISADVFDDRGISSVSVVYSVDNVEYEILMNLESTSYSAVIPAIGLDTNVNYLIRVIDIFGHEVNSSSNQFYIDGMAPVIENSIRSQAHSNAQDQVEVLANVFDTNPMRSLELYYTRDGNTWESIDFVTTSVQTIQGRYPVGGDFINTTHTQEFTTGPMRSLSLSVETTGNSLSVKVWGYRIDTQSYQLILDNTNMVTSDFPPFTWENPIFDQWRIEITEADSTAGFSYSYQVGVEAAYIAQIPQSQINGTTEYYIVATDMANRTTSTETYSFYTDGIKPGISNITQFDPVSEFASARVFANITDNIGISTPVLYYSNNEINWYSISMSLSTNNGTMGLYYADIPATESGLISYYIVTIDYYNLETKSFTWYYTIDKQAEIQFVTHYPTDISLSDQITFTAYAVDDFRVDRVALYYWTDTTQGSLVMDHQNGGYTAQIPAINNNTNLYYYISVKDSYGHFTNSTIDQLVIDGSAPTIIYTQTPNESIEGPENVVIRISATDNAALNLTSGVLYYSYNQIDWVQTTMQYASGTTSIANFVGLIPDTPTNWIYYFTSISDKVGLTNSTEVRSYYLETYPDRDGDQLADWTEENITFTNPDNNDTDGDTLSDYDEIYVYNTDPANADTDGDGMADGWEVQYEFDPLVDDGSGDRDGDGLSNAGEFENGTNPDIADTDEDGMSDGYEVQYNLDPLADDSGEDNDNDNLTNLEEFGYGTNPQSNDTDSDQMPDLWEIENLLNPLEDNAQNDTDSDELSDLDEYLNNTDPQSPDTDGDGMTDGYEVRYGLDPLTDDAGEDPDGDGYTNLTEFELGSDPNDPDSPDNDPGFVGLAVGIGMIGISGAGLAFFIRRAGGPRAFLERLRSRLDNE